MCRFRFVASRTTVSASAMPTPIASQVAMPTSPYRICAKSVSTNSRNPLSRNAANSDQCMNMTDTTVPQAPSCG